MQLLRLEMKGFKSFADKTIVKFSPGMTAIVGPNGSGKSNITDAMRWVLGESNVRNLRGQKAEDIIFSGTEKRRPLGAAEVTLVFDNADGQLGEELSEVAITRRIYRTGESEFYINKRACRLKDIHLLLADTGLGKDSMAIIGQNRIDAILNSKPEERRLIFEDVAGISRFKLNKEDALRRINATERNMERVNDVRATLEDQLGPLEEKAEKTRQYMELSGEKRFIDGALGFHNYKTADRLFTRFENDNISYTSELAELETVQTELETKRQSLQLAASQGQEQLKKWEEEFTNLQREEERLSGNLRLLDEQLRTAQKDEADIVARIGELEATKKAEQQQIFILNKMLADDEEQLITQKEELKTLEDKYHEASKNLEEVQARLQASQDEADNRHKKHIELIGFIETGKSEIHSLDNRIQEAEDLKETLSKEMAQVLQELEEAKNKHQEVASEFEAINERRNDLLLQEKNLNQTIRDMRHRLQKARSESQKAEGRLELLAQWEDQHEGYLEGTKNILNAQGTWRQDVRGAVGELFTVDNTYVTAIETALGGSVNHIVTTSSKAAAEGVKYLKEIQGGRITFLPMETVQGRLQDTPALHETGVVGLAVDCIKFDKQYKGIFQYLLGRILIVETMEKAIAIQKKYHQQLRLVTLTGEQFNPGGSLTGGKTKRKKASVLARKEEVQGLEDRLKSLTSEQTQLLEEVNLKEETLEKLQKEKLDMEERRQHLNLLNTSGQTQIENIQNQYARKERVYKEQILKADSYANEKLAIQEKIDTYQAQVDAMTGVGHDGDSSGGLMAQLPFLQKAQQEAYEAFTAMRLDYGNLEQAKVERTRQKKEKEWSVDTFDSRIAPLEEKLSAIRAKLQSALPEQVQSSKTLLEETKAKVEELSTLREQAYGQSKEEQAQIESIVQEQQELDKRQRRVQQQLLDMESKLTRYRMDCERAVEDLKNLGFTLEEAQKIDLQGSVNDWKQKQADLMAAIAGLGSINPNAVAEFEEAKERYDFLTSQLEDLDTAKLQLQAVIAEMDKAMTDQLVEVLDIVRVRFQDVFSKLFNGGTAQIVLTDPDNILTGGIDFYIQPPGKKRQQLTLLSGGERALTVIALLFSFLYYRPAPFCVLDEVDAALDEANVERFSHYLHQLDHSTQFIVVSHRKPTMEAAEVLQGVTMVERGVSRLLTVTFDDVKEDLS